jgi:uncharacterized membrane protein (DUF4010 family)
LVAPRLFASLAAPIGVMMAVSAAATALEFLRVRGAAQRMPAQKNPTELKSALVFAALYAGVLMALSATKTYIDDKGLYAVAVLSGLTDMDAITLSTSRMAQLSADQGGIETSIAWRLIVAATMANLLFKWMACLTLGSRKLALRVALLFAAPVIAGGLLLWFWT